MSEFEEDNSDLAIINDETINWVEVVTRRLFSKYSVPLLGGQIRVKKFKDYFESILDPRNVSGKYNDEGIYRLVYGEYALDEQTIGYAQSKNKSKEIDRRLKQFNMGVDEPQLVNHREVLFFNTPNNPQEFKNTKLMYRFKLKPLCLNICFIPQLGGDFNKIKLTKGVLVDRVGQTLDLIKQDIERSKILVEHTQTIFGYIESVNKSLSGKGDKVDPKFKSELLYNCVVEKDIEKEASQQVIYGTQITLVLKLNTVLVKSIIESFGDTDEKIVQDFSRLPETIELVTAEFAYSPVMTASFSNYMKKNTLNLDGILLLSSMRYNRDKSRLEFLRSIYSTLRGVDSGVLPDILFNIHHTWFTVAFLDPFKLELTIEKKAGIDPEQKKRMISEERSRRRYAKEFYTGKGSQMFLDILNIYGAKICDAPPVPPEEEEPPGPDDDDDNSYVPNDDGSNDKFTKVGMSLKDWFKRFNSDIILDSSGGGNRNNDLPSLRQIINLLLILLQESVSTQGMRVECVGGDSHKRWAWGILTEITADIDAKLYYTRTSSKSDTIIDKLIFILQFLTIFFEQNDYFKFKRIIYVKFGSHTLNIVIDSTKQERMCSFRALFNWVVDILSLDVKISYKIYDEDGIQIAFSKYLSSPLDIVLKKVDQQTISKKNSIVNDLAHAPPNAMVLETDLKKFFDEEVEDEDDEDYEEKDDDEEEDWGYLDEDEDEDEDDKNLMDLKENAGSIGPAGFVDPEPPIDQEFIGVRRILSGKARYILRPSMELSDAAEDIGLLVSKDHRAERVAVGKSGKDDERNAAIKFAVLIFKHLKEYNFFADEANTPVEFKYSVEKDLTNSEVASQLEKLEVYFKIPTDTDPDGYKQVRGSKKSSKKTITFDRYKKVVKRFLRELKNNLYNKLQQFEPATDNNKRIHYLFLQNIIELILNYKKTFCFRTAHDFYFDLSLYKDLQTVVSQYMSPAPPLSAAYTLANMVIPADPNSPLTDPNSPLNPESIFSLCAYTRESIDTDKRYISPLSHNSFQDHITRGVNTITNQLISQQQLYNNRKVQWESWLEKLRMSRGGSNVTSIPIEYIDELSGGDNGDNDVIPIEVEVEID